MGAGAHAGIGASSVGLLTALGFSFTTPLLPQPASVVILLAALVVLVVTKMDALPLLGAGALAGFVLFLLGVPLA